MKTGGRQSTHGTSQRTLSYHQHTSSKSCCIRVSLALRIQVRGQAIFFFWGSGGGAAPLCSFLVVDGAIDAVAGPPGPRPCRFSELFGAASFSEQRAFGAANFRSVGSTDQSHALAEGSGKRKGKPGTRVCVRASIYIRFTPQCAPTRLGQSVCNGETGGGDTVAARSKYSAVQRGVVRRPTERWAILPKCFKTFFFRWWLLTFTRFGRELTDRIIQF